MASRTAAYRPAVSPTRNRQRPQAIDVSEEERRAFGGSSEAGRMLTDRLHTDMRRVRVGQSDGLSLDSDALAAAVRDQDARERERHQRQTKQAREEYDQFLDARGLERPEYHDIDHEGPGDVARALTTRGRSAQGPSAGEAVWRPDPVDAPRGVDDRDDGPAPRVRARSANTRRTSRADLEGPDTREDAVDADVVRETGVGRTAGREVLAAGQGHTEDRERTPFGATSAQPVPAAFTAVRPSQADVDRLWDWIRSDRDHGQRFIGARITTSVELHALMLRVVQGEESRSSLARALYLRGATVHPHIGFGVLVPILMPEKMAGVHVYLRPDLRGEIERYIPSLISVAAEIMPGVRLAIMDAKPEWNRLLAAYGFVAHTIFVGGK